MTITLIMNVFTTFFMTGLIWLVQVTHYPSFNYIDIKGWSLFHNFHTRTITTIVAPTMVMQLISSIALLFENNYVEHSALLIVNAVGTSIIFLITFFISVPLHNQICKKYDLLHVKKLIATNWLRTILWSLLSLNLANILIRHFK